MSFRGMEVNCLSARLVLGEMGQLEQLGIVHTSLGTSNLPVLTWDMKPICGKTAAFYFFLMSGIY